MRLDEFFSAFFPSDDEAIFLRGLPPKGVPRELGDPIYGRQTSRKELRENKTLQNELKQLNKKNGLYFVPNSGGFKDFQIERVNAIFCEIDDKPIIEQLDLYDYDSPLTPSFCIETRKSIHAYWLLDNRDSIRVEDWVTMQKALIDYFKSDAGIKNPNRLMRVPYFNHIHWDGRYHYKRIDIVRSNPNFTYSIDEIREAFPYKENEISIPDFNQNSEYVNIHEQIRIAISRHPTYKVERDGVHATCKGICHNARYGKTAIMVNLKTGAVFCHAGCSYWQIARAFGIEKPNKKRFEPRLVPRREQTSNTAKLLREYGRK